MNREEDMLAASSMYYLQDIKMEAIASHLHMSRSSVSRLLRDARTSGLVEITLRGSASRASGIGSVISERFGVEVYVVPLPDSAEATERLEQVATAAARMVRLRHDHGHRLGYHGRCDRAASQPKAHARKRRSPTERGCEQPHLGGRLCR
jgi:DNA-binding transcriptional regulator LsrR (DeoR family)